MRFGIMMPRFSLDCVFIILIGHFVPTFQHSLEELSEKHYEACPCIGATDDYFDKSLETVHSDCWLKCFLNGDCFAIEYCEVSKTCKLYNHMSIGVDPNSINNGDCSSSSIYSHTTTTTSEMMFLMKRRERGDTFDCEQIKQEDNSVIDGYFHIQIRRIPIQVYCLMTDSPPTTYLDVSGVSIYGGNADPNRNPSYPTTRTWTRVQLVVNPCMTFIISNDTTFSDISPDVSGEFSGNFLDGQAFGYSTDCLGSGQGEFIVDLTSTDFFVPTRIEFKMLGSTASTNLENFGPNRQYVRLQGKGNCGQSVIRMIRGQVLLHYKLPVLLQRR